MKVVNDLEILRTILSLVFTIYLLASGFYVSYLAVRKLFRKGGDVSEEDSDNNS